MLFHILLIGIQKQSSVIWLTESVLISFSKWSLTFKYQYCSYYCNPKISTLNFQTYAFSLFNQCTYSCNAFLLTIVKILYHLHPVKTISKANQQRIFISLSSLYFPTIIFSISIVILVICSTFIPPLLMSPLFSNELCILTYFAVVSAVISLSGHFCVES